MAELWKIKREALRIFYQVADVLTVPFDRVIQKKYDRNFQKNIKLLDGNRPLERKIALFFIYQPGRLSKSIGLTCKYFSDHGYSVLLVASTSVSLKETQGLKEHCWRILLRPNYGYDFGGYRDGLRVLTDAKISPDRLIILNDSIWFPTYENTSLVERLENEGLAFNSPVFVNITERSPENRHFQSFFFLLRKEALQSEAFLNYWKKYRVSSKKRIVLKLGEKGFSQAMFNGGFGGSAPATRVVLLNLLEKQPNNFLFKSLCYAAYADKDLLKDSRSIIAAYADNDDWRKRALVHMRKAFMCSSPIGVFVYASTVLLDFSFLKKRSFATVFDGMRWQYVRAVKNGDLPAPHPDIMAEIEASSMDGRFTTDPSILTKISATKAA